jgi:PIN domain nuclease of toxin-antitoxin system
LRLLLDTHVLLWWLNDLPKLGRKARDSISDPEATVWISAATAWEIAIKVCLGRLELPEPPEICIPRELERGGFLSLPVTMAHALSVRTLPVHHGDPFDRILIAQARIEGLTLVSADEIIGRYDVPLLRV